MSEVFPSRITGHWIREHRINDVWVKIDSCPNWWLKGRLTFRDMLNWWPKKENIRIRFEKR